ncbi:MAG TPA: RHS repeat-associated core domain-containing protein [Candidatus Krumholzibacteriaceae bacterium]|nr:RHS repeat-associated core domain-containing protein [Candidatus Krumholzibacteriaceae bacterium]
MESEDKEPDGESDLDYFGARYYDRSQYRFISVNPVLGQEAIGNAQRWNPYSYCGNNPIIYIDPDGKEYLVFIRSESKIYLFSSDNRLLGSWNAKNSTAPGHTPFPNGDWAFAGFLANTSGDPAIGPLGFISFEGTDSCGVHAGRAWDIMTNGCIRTENAAMANALLWHFAGDRMTKIRVYDTWADVAWVDMLRKSLSRKPAEGVVA